MINKLKSCAALTFAVAILSSALVIGRLARIYRCVDGYFRRREQPATIGELERFHNQQPEVDSLTQEFLYNLQTGVFQGNSGTQTGQN